MLANSSTPGTDPEQINAQQMNAGHRSPIQSTPGTSDEHDYLSGTTGTHSSHSNAPVFGLIGEPPR
jgi:hypothetical protein